MRKEKKDDSKNVYYVETNNLKKEDAEKKVKKLLEKFKVSKSLIETRKEEVVGGLCFRCEHRAMFLEKGHQPRCECGDIKSSKWSCYMYSPVRPMVLTKSDKKDKRPQFGPYMISSRSSGVVVEQDKIQLKLHKYKNGSMIYWAPKEVKK